MVRIFQQSSIALLYAIDPQNRAEHKKKLVFVFSSCYKIFSLPSLAGRSRLPGNPVS